MRPTGPGSHLMCDPGASYFKYPRLASVTSHSSEKRRVLVANSSAEATRCREVGGFAYGLFLLSLAAPGPVLSRVHHSPCSTYLWLPSTTVTSLVRLKESSFL